MTDRNKGSSRPPAWTYWPAVMVLGTCGVLTLVVLLMKREPDVAALVRRAETAVAANDTETTVLTYQHLLTLEPGRPKHVVAFAQALDRLGKRSEAMNVLGTAAPEGSDGDPAAHLLMGQWLIEARVLGGQQDAAILQRAVRHLDAARSKPEFALAAGEQKRLAEAMLARASTRPAN